MRPRPLDECAVLTLVIIPIETTIEQHKSVVKKKGQNLNSVPLLFSNQINLFGRFFLLRFGGLLFHLGY